MAEIAINCFYFGSVGSPDRVEAIQLVAEASKILTVFGNLILKAIWFSGCRGQFFNYVIQFRHRNVRNVYNDKEV